MGQHLASLFDSIVITEMCTDDFILFTECALSWQAAKLQLCLLS